MRNFIAACLCLFSMAMAAYANEEIVRFHSDVTVNADSSMDVTESITVTSEGNRIRHGIFRDFPTRYTDKRGTQQSVEFAVQNVARDGHYEPYKIESISGGKRIRIGDKDVFIESGTHEYVIRYHSARQLGFFENFDELYWNVTGNGWDFEIKDASIVVHLPPQAIIKQSAVYTGRQGSQAKDARVTNSSANTFAAQTTRSLQANEGLTIAVAWQKGIVAPPSQFQKLIWWLQDNAGLTGLGLTLLTVAGYFFSAWWRVGQDPKGGAIIPLFHPPERFEPAAVRYVWKQKFDHTALAAAFVGLGVKKYLKITNANGEYTIEKLAGQGAALTPSEASLHHLIPEIPFELDQSNHVELASLLNNLEHNLERSYDGILFDNNYSWFTIGTIISILGLICSALLMHNQLGITGLFIGSFSGVFWLAVRVAAILAIRGASVAKGFFQKLKSIVGLIFLIPFVGAGLAVPVLLWTEESASPALIIFAGTTMVIGLLNVLFYYLLPAPTVAGRYVLDQIEGFRLYLSTAEEKRLDLLNPPEKTPALFERYLPYAMALDCENAWNQKFAAVLAAAAAAGAASTWYSSTGHGGGFGGMTSGLSDSLASTISSSSTAPGSSSGSSGGGSSGGGGGGGGGGGW
jgi:uncharacterized membrane protein YgcG